MEGEKIITIFMVILFIFSCASFIKEEEIMILKEYEKGIYLLKKQVGEGKGILKKSQKVKIYIKTSDEAIKVYCYPSNIDFVKADRTLILYLFEDDFNNEFDIKLFDERLFKVIEHAGANVIK